MGAQLDLFEEASSRTTRSTDQWFADTINQLDQRAQAAPTEQEATLASQIADALAKGVFILGPEAGMALVERLPDVEAVIVGADNTVRVSSGLTGRLVQLAPPTDAP